MSIANLDCEKCGALLTAYRGVPCNRVRRWPSRKTIFALAVLLVTVAGVGWGLVANGWVSLGDNEDCIKLRYQEYEQKYCLPPTSP